MIAVVDVLIPLAVVADVSCVAGQNGFDLCGVLATTCAILWLAIVVGKVHYAPSHCVIISLSIASALGAWRPVYFWIMLARFFFGFPCGKGLADGSPEKAGDDHAKLVETQTKKRARSQDVEQPFSGKQRKPRDEEPWSFTILKVAYKAIESGAKTWEGRPTTTMVNVQVGHLVAFRYNRCAARPRIVCKVVDVRFFANVHQMVLEIGWEALVPWAKSAEDAVTLYGRLGPDYAGKMKAYQLQYLRLEA